MIDLLIPFISVYFKHDV